MAVWDNLKRELDTAGKAMQDVLEKAGKATQGALEEGKVRVDAFRERQLADRAAQALGYAIFRAEQSGSQLDADTKSRLTATLAERDAEASRLEGQLNRTASGGGSTASDSTTGSTGTSGDAGGASSTV